MADVIHTKRNLPIEVGHLNNSYVMANADIYRTPEEVLIQIVVKGERGQYISEFLEQPEPIGLRFIPIPVRNAGEKREKN